MVIFYIFFLYIIYFWFKCWFWFRAGFGSDTSFSLNAGFDVSVSLPGACSGDFSAVLFFIGNILPVKLLRIFSLILRNNPMLFIKGIFSTGFTPLFKRLIY